MYGNNPHFIAGHGGSDRQSDDSSKEGVSDSHPETLTDPEFSDPPVVTSSPPQSGDEVKREQKEKVTAELEILLRYGNVFVKKNVFEQGSSGMGHMNIEDKRLLICNL